MAFEADSTTPPTIVNSSVGRTDWLNRVGYLWGRRRLITRSVTNAKLFAPVTFTEIDYVQRKVSPPFGLMHWPW